MLFNYHGSIFFKGSDYGSGVFRLDRKTQNGYMHVVRDADCRKDAIRISLPNEAGVLIAGGIQPVHLVDKAI
eukprot:XP_001706743.1 Hypothetical protein GL50803_92313 [Giardia lamblia ATCC 50803]